MMVLNRERTRILQTEFEILAEYGSPIEYSNQYYKKGELVINCNTLIWKRCQECGKEKQVQFQTICKNPQAPCLSCSKKGAKNAAFGKPASNHGKKRSQDTVSKIVETRKRNKSYKHSLETRLKMSKNRKGSSNGNYGHYWSEVKRKAWAHRVAQMHLDGVYNRKSDTIPEQEFKQLLEENNIQFTQQFIVDTKVYDFYIPNSNLLIEIDGTYWHGKNLPFERMNETQKHNRVNDAEKNRIAFTHGFILERIWEDEISSRFYAIFGI